MSMSQFIYFLLLSLIAKGSSMQIKLYSKHYRLTINKVILRCTTFFALSKLAQEHCTDSDPSQQLERHFYLALFQRFQI